MQRDRNTRPTDLHAGALTTESCQPNNEQIESTLLKVMSLNGHYVIWADQGLDNINYTGIIGIR